MKRLGAWCGSANLGYAMHMLSMGDPWGDLRGSASDSANYG